MALYILNIPVREPLGFVDFTAVCVPVLPVICAVVDSTQIQCHNMQERDSQTASGSYICSRMCIRFKQSYALFCTMSSIWGFLLITRQPIDEGVLRKDLGYFATTHPMTSSFSISKEWGHVV